MSRRRSRLVVVLGLLGLLLAGCTGAHHATPPIRTSGPSARTSSRAPTTASATSLGPEGVRATWVQQENARPGSTDWRIPRGAYGDIAGFADLGYASAGERVTLYVSTTAPSFHVEAYRMGYYGGAGGRLVWRSPEEPAMTQPRCEKTARINMVSCSRWRPSASVTLGTDFLQGDYLFKLISSRSKQSYIPLTVWDPSSHAAYLIKNDVLTWQAWNTYGGYNFYGGPDACPPDEYPPCSRARVVSFDRPYATGQGAGDFLGLELPLVSLMEQHGLDVAYATDLTLIEHPGFLSQHRVLLSLGHDECWDLRERQAAVAAERHGMNIAFFGASPILRHVRVQRSPLGPDREVVDYRDSSEDPLNGHGNRLEVTGNTWAAPPANWPEGEFVGDLYSGFLKPDAHPVPFVVADPTAWIFAGTGARRGTSIPGLIGSDVDAFDPSSHPANLQILGHSPIPVAVSETHGWQWDGYFYSDMTYYTDPGSKAGLFDSGTNNWIPALTSCSGRCQQFVRRVTLNLLYVFGQQPAGRVHPSRANWRKMPPY